MKKLLAILALALLTSCIDVDDFGKHWDEGVIDPKIEGLWLTTDGNKAPDMKSDKWRLTREKDVYVLDMLREKEETPPQILRTLVWRDYTYLMIKERGKPKGSLIRYTQADNTVSVYGVDAKLVQEWLEKKQPGAKNFRVVQSEYFHGLKVMLLDASTMDLLSEMPQEYWKEAGQFIKLQ